MMEARDIRAAHHGEDFCESHLSILPTDSVELKVSRA